MFTGIIEGIGQVAGVFRRAGGMSLKVALGVVAEGLRAGGSVCVDGVCLTAAAVSGQRGDFDVSSETLGMTTLQAASVGRPVNLERAMSADGRFGGHIVQGHIDGMGRIAAIRRDGDFAVFTIEPPPVIMQTIVEKGSVALDGISLTVAAVKGRFFDVALIPQTLLRTTWGRARAGQTVNIETDILVRAAGKQADKFKASGLTREKLLGMGF